MSSSSSTMRIRSRMQCRYTAARGILGRTFVTQRNGAGNSTIRYSPAPGFLLQFRIGIAFWYFNIFQPMLFRIPHHWIALYPALASACAAVVLSSAALAADPYRTQALISPASRTSLERRGRSCGRAGGESGPLTLADVIDRALCNNPQTRQSWIATRVEAARAGRARADYLPDLSIQAGANANRTLALRRCNRQTRQPVRDTHTDLCSVRFRCPRCQSGKCARTTASGQLVDTTRLCKRCFCRRSKPTTGCLPTRANVEAAAEAERAAAESLRAAEVRHRVGTATPADRLQARTAHSQTRLALTRAEGEARIAAGGLANAMGMEADVALGSRPCAGRSAG